MITKEKSMYRLMDLNLDSADIPRLLNLLKAYKQSDWYNPDGDDDNFVFLVADSNGKFFLEINDHNFTLGSRGLALA